MDYSEGSENDWHIEGGDLSSNPSEPNVWYAVKGPEVAFPNMMPSMYRKKDAVLMANAKKMYSLIENYFDLVAYLEPRSAYEASYMNEMRKLIDEINQ